jgi:hypothetical protein
MNQLYENGNLKDHLDYFHISNYKERSLYKEPEFIRDHVIGRDIACKGKADHLKGQQNLQLLGSTKY